MAIVYKYVNSNTDETEYIGIVTAENRTLDKRIYEHSREQRFYTKNWRIFYFECENKSVAEAWESHLIEKYKTYSKLNKAKCGWGLNPYIPNDEDLWIEITQKSKKEKSSFYDKYGVYPNEILKFNGKDRFAICYSEEDPTNNNQLKTKLFFDEKTDNLFQNGIVKIMGGVCNDKFITLFCNEEKAEDGDDIYVIQKIFYVTKDEYYDKINSYYRSMNND